MLTLPRMFVLVGLFLAGAAALNARDRRWATAAFWTVLAVPFLFGDEIVAAAKAGTRWPAQAMGLGVVSLAVLATLGGRRGAVVRAAPPQPPPSTPAPGAGNAVFLPALAIPLVTLAIVLAARFVPALATVIPPADTTLVALAVAAVTALGLALAMTRSHPRHALREGRRLLDAIGWAAVLPMLLATLGAVFVATGVGDAIAHVVAGLIPTESRLACLLAYGLGMVAFTVVMGNAFAAFPVMTAGIGLPLLVARHGGDPAALGALGMLTGYCGTLLTPMAANFNIVPTMLLDLSPYAVIRAQWPTAIALMTVNLALMYAIVFR